MKYAYLKEIIQDATQYELRIQTVHILKYQSFLNMRRCNHMIFKIRYRKYLQLECSWKVANFSEINISAVWALSLDSQRSIFIPI